MVIIRETFEQTGCFTMNGLCS